MTTNFQAIKDTFIPLLKGHRVEQFTKALDVFAEAEKADSIYNPDYVSYKDTLNRSVEHAVSNLRDTVENIYTMEGSKMFALHTVASYVKQLKSFKREYSYSRNVEVVRTPELEAMILQLELLIPLAALVKDLKGKTVSAKVKQAEVKAKKQADLPKLTADEFLTLNKIFDAMLEGMKKEFQANRTLTYLKYVAKWENRFTWQEFREATNIRGNRDRQEILFMRDKYDIFNAAGEKLKIHEVAQRDSVFVKINARHMEHAIKEQVERDTRQMFDEFQNKQCAKLAGVLKGRAIEKTDMQLSGYLTGEIDFTLVGGDFFTMKNQIVGKVSVLGNWFYQFPTHFMNVRKDGKKFGTPTEERMKKEF